MTYTELLKLARDNGINPHDLIIATEVQYTMECVVVYPDKSEKMDFNKICDVVSEVYMKDERNRPIWALTQATVSLILQNCEPEDEHYAISKWDIYEAADELIQ